MNKTILVAGGLGYIGSHTVLKLIQQGFEVVIIDNLDNASPKMLDILKELAQKELSFYNADIRDKDALRNIFKAHSIDSVINFAGYKAVAESVAKPLLYFDNNLIGMIHLLEVMAEFNVKKLVFSSSATVYEMPQAMPLREEAKCGAINPYGQTKLMIETMLEALSASDSAWSIIALRYFNPLGAHESGRIGDNPRGIPNNLAPYITQVASGKLEILSIFGDDYDTKDGTCIRDYIHIDDLAQGHAAALKKLENNPRGYDIYNLGSGKGYTVLEIIDAFEKVIGREIPKRVTGRRAGDSAVSYADIDKAVNELNWKPEKELNEMCASAWNWQKKNPNGIE